MHSRLQGIWFLYKKGFGGALHLRALKTEAQRREGPSESLQPQPLLLPLYPSACLENPEATFSSTQQLPWEVEIIRGYRREARSGQRFLPHLGLTWASVFQIIRSWSVKPASAAC